ncbi:MAG TPA: hypothetical protein VOA41_06950 [Candidatus Dormibacteraeota bacterium]|nr:hypothetical protein [Candidatus Dormibacteraeota bacterium]
MSTQLVLWYSGLFLQILVWALTVWRRLHLRLPVFTSYLIILTARDVFLVWAYHSAGYSSRLYFFSFWTTQSIVLAARAATIGELAWNTARPYLGFRIVLKWVLGGIVVTLLLRATFEAVAKSYGLPALILGLERNFELTAVVVLVVVLAMSARYQVPLPGTQRLIAFGLLSYSVVQILNNSISRQWLDSYFRSWAVIRFTSFHAALVIWVIAILQAPPAPATSPPAPDSDSLVEFMRRGTQVTRELAARLKLFRKKPRNLR